MHEIHSIAPACILAWLPEKDELRNRNHLNVRDSDCKSTDERTHSPNDVQGEVVATRHGTPELCSVLGELTAGQCQHALLLEVPSSALAIENTSHNHDGASIKKKL